MQLYCRQMLLDDEALNFTLYTVTTVRKYKLQ